MPDAEAGPEGWSSRDKFAAVLETAALNEADLAEYCRKRGLYPAQITVWRSACEQVNDWDRASTARLGQATKEEKKRVKDLERELTRRDRALAEAAALLILRKKASAIWGPKPLYAAQSINVCYTLLKRGPFFIQERPIVDGHPAARRSSKFRNGKWCFLPHLLRATQRSHDQSWRELILNYQPFVG